MPGDRDTDALLEAVYDELRKLAANRLRERKNFSLLATAVLRIKCICGWPRKMVSSGAIASILFHLRPR